MDKLEVRTTIDIISPAISSFTDYKALFNDITRINS